MRTPRPAILACAIALALAVGPAASPAPRAGPSGIGRAPAGSGADPLIEAASPYEAFRADISAFAAAPPSRPGELEAALARAAGRDPDALTAGWMAASALAAARSPAFSRGIAAVEARYGRAAVLKALVRDPTYPSRRRGYDEAISFILDAAAADGAAAQVAARRLDDARASRALSWLEAEPAETRMAQLRAQRAAPAAFASGSPGAAPHLAGLRLAAGQAMLARRIATLAALHLLRASGEDAPDMASRLQDAPTRACANIERLQLYQCVSVTQTANEAADCLTAHAVKGEGACFAAVLEPR